MVALVQVLITTLLFYVFINQNMDIRFLYDARPRVIFSTTYMSLELRLGKQKRKKRKLKLANVAKSLKFYQTFMQELLKRSTVTLSSFRSTEISERAGHTFGTVITTFSPIIIRYLKTHALTYQEQPSSDSVIDLSISFSILSLFISFLLVAYYHLKIYFKRLVRNVE